MKNFKEDLHRIKSMIFDLDGVLSSEKIMIDAQSEHIRAVNTKDEFAIREALKKGLHIGIIADENSEAIRTHYEKCGVTDFYLSSSLKINVFNDLLQKRNIAADEILYMGDDILDYEVMLQVGMPVCPANAVPEIQSIARYISHQNGGEGCVRDVIEQVLKAQGKWMNLEY